MADRGDTHYHLPRLNFLFMVSSALLLGCAIWMVLADWKREWKGYQRDYQALEHERAVSELAALEEDPEWSARRAELEQQLQELERRLGADQDYRAARAAVRAAEGESYRAETDFKIAKSVLNWERFLYNQARALAGDAADDEAFRAAQERLETARQVSEQADAARAEAESRFQELASEKDRVEAELERLTRTAAQLETRRRSLAPGLFRTLRNAPALDFVAPTIQVRKQVLPNLRRNYSFVTVQRVDMCASCHVAIDNPAYAAERLQAEGLDVDPVLQAHPRLDLFLSPSSSHPIESFGCTICHDGASETLDFTRAVHTPEDDEEEHRWEEELGWHHWHLWEWPMLPARYTEAGCYSCHAMGGTLESIAPEAPKLTRGLHLMEQYGCYSCHKINGWRIDRKPGPTLRSIRAKISPDFARSWIANPHQFRASTWMPQIFHLENGVSKAWEDTAIAAVQAYLWERSERAQVPPIPSQLRSAADAGRGEALFQQVGCLACHQAPGSEGHAYSGFGPDLTGIGSKVGEDWLYQWLLDPQGWWAETRMPNLRLEAQEAADLAVYLAGWQADDWEPIEVGTAEAELEAQALAFLATRRSLDEARATLEEWRRDGGQARVLAEVGRQWIARQGCYSCHDIPGFETSMPIGTELSDWGNKNVHKLAFELWNEDVPGHHEGAVAPSRHAFAELKLSNPRRFDRGVEVAPLDRLRMPEFRLDPEEIEALTTVLLGLKDDRQTILPAALPKPDATAQALEKGAFLVRQKNCYGCHKFEMDMVRATFEFGDGEITKTVHGLVTLEDDDEEATYVQLWRTDPDLVVEQDSGRVGEVAELLWELNDDEPWPVQRGAGGGIMEQLAGYYVDSGEVGDQQEAFPLLPPILYREGEKVRAPWLTQFLLAPYTLRPWMVVRMPRFRFTEAEARDAALYFAALARKEWPSRYARALRAEAEQSLEEFAAEAQIDAALLRDIESGGRFNQNTFEKLLRYGEAEGFALDHPPAIPFEEVRERSPVYIAAKNDQIPNYLERGAALVGKQGIDCYACHIRDGKDPGGDKLSWGPDLSYTRDRLRPDWVRAWVTDAQKIYPGTKMPTASGFMADPKLQDILPGSVDELIEAVKDFLMNSDRVPAEADAVTRLDADPNSAAGAAEGGR